MHHCTTLLKFVMLSNVFICVSFGKSYENDQNDQQHIESIHTKSIERPILNELIARPNKTDTNILDVIQKEPKFFDEFECKLTSLDDVPSTISRITLIIVHNHHHHNLSHFHQIILVHNNLISKTKQK